MNKGQNHSLASYVPYLFFLNRQIRKMDPVSQTKTQELLVSCKMMQQIRGTGCDIV